MPNGVVGVGRTAGMRSKVVTKSVNGDRFLEMPKKKKRKVVPRRGPATNLRKAGAHEDKKRKMIKALDQKEDDDLVALGSWAFEDE
jgi:hypothetical protein